LSIAVALTLLAGILVGWLHYKKRQPEAGPSVDSTVRFRGSGRYDHSLVGVSHYHGNLARICRDRDSDEGKVVDAVLILDNSNAKDSNAVRVEVQGQTVGYLPPELARAYRRRLEEGAYLNVRGICRAKITSRMYRSIGEDYVIRLDLPDKK
jgi:hypothetical protein